MSKKRIAIFASGSGSNAENICEYFKNSEDVDISLILTNKKDAFVLQRAAKLGVSTHIFTKSDWVTTPKVDQILEAYTVDFIVLAGFLLLVPARFVEKYPNKIINIHPALLPKYGGKGMYGSIVHEAVVKNKDKESGITIHFVNENYDEGGIIFQGKCEVLSSDTADEVAAKVHKLEYVHFPKVIENILKNL